MFDVPSHVRLSEWITVLVLTVASVGVAVRVSGVYSRDVYGGIVALLLTVTALLVWALFHNNSIHRQRELSPESVSKDGE